VSPLPRAHQELPSTDHLYESPQLAALALLQANLRVAGQVLGIQHPELGSLHPLHDLPDPDELLAQLIIDRCRELSELVTNYRRVIHPERPLRGTFDDDFPF
jgi:hypothetical protein